MTVTNGYTSFAEWRAWERDPATSDQATVEAAIEAASRHIDAMCGRYFYQDSSATARTFVPSHAECSLYTDDISTTTGLLVATDDDDDGTFETSWTITTDFRLSPPNGRGMPLVAGPYYEILLTGQRWWPVSPYRLPTVQVTARWGWPAVPDAVAQACLMLTSRLVALRGAPLGVAGFGEFGAVRVQGLGDVERLLAAYRRLDRTVGIA